jgi:plasmid stability protein
MPDILVRDLAKSTIKQLKTRAADNGRSLQSEVRDILERAARELSLKELRRRADDISKQFAGRRFTDSADLIRDDRDSR